MPFVVDDLVTWLVGLFADAGRRKLITWVFGPEQAGALRQAATAAVNSVAAELRPEVAGSAEMLAMVISQVLKDPVTEPSWGGEATFLEALRAGIAGPLAVLDDVSLTGTGQSSAQVLGISAATLAETLTGHLVREILVRGSRGGPLQPLASQLNHDVTYLQGQRLEEIVGQLAEEVRQALARPEDKPAATARLAIQQASRAGYLSDTPDVPEGYIPLGAVTDNGRKRRFMVPISLIQRGVLIAGVNCKQKFWTTKCLLDKLHDNGVWWLVVEPSEPYEVSTKIDMGSIVQHDSRIVIMDDGPDSIPVTFNPLRPEGGFPFHDHFELLRALFLATASSNNSEEFTHALSTALHRAYADHGWDISSPDGRSTKFNHPMIPDLKDLKSGTWLAGGEEYRIRDAEQDTLDALVDLLLGGRGHWWLQDGNRVDIKGLLACRAGARIANIADEAKGFLIGTVLIQIFEFVKTTARKGSPGDLRHVSLIKDASMLLPNTRPRQRSETALATIERMLQEMGHYGEGLILDEQFPAKLASGTLQRAGLKIIHRLAGDGDRNTVSAAVGADTDISSRLMTLEPGVAMVMAEGMDKPVEVRLQLSTLIRIL